MEQQFGYDLDRVASYRPDRAGFVSTNAAGATAGTDRVLRGGGWNAPAQNCRSACRDHSAPGNAHYNIGFRPAIVLP